MNQPQKLSHCSITFSGLTSLLDELDIPELDLDQFVLPLFNTHDLRPILVSRGIYPARDFPHLISKRLPDIFITYNWKDNILEVRGSIWNALSYCVNLGGGFSYDPYDLQDVATDGVTFWLDWIFLDQSSRNVDVELDSIMPILFRESTVHVVLSSTALSRVWCCYELAQFNRKAAENHALELTSLIPGDLDPYPLWESVEATDPDDKLKIERRIEEAFPNGLKDVEYLMVQAGLAADLRGDIGAAALRIKEASQSWIESFLA